jgi:hypothetical protein
MKLKRTLLRGRIIWLIDATLLVAFPAWAQTFGIGTATSPVFQVVDNSIGGNTTYNCSATANVSMSPYITQNGQYFYTATLIANCSLVSGPAPGIGVVIFGQNASLTHSTSIDKAYTEPFGGSTITLNSYTYDYWDDAAGNYEATYQDYNTDAGGPAVQLGFSVGYGPVSLSITPISSDHTIALSGPSSGANGQILMKSTLSTTATSSFQTRFSGVFENGDYVKLNNIQLNDSSVSGGGEIGYVTLSIPLTGAHSYYNESDDFPIGSATVDSFTQGPTMTLQVPYVRDQGIPMPTVSVTQSANQVQVGQTVTLNVQVINNSQAVSLGNTSQVVQVSLDTSSYNTWFHLPSGQSDQMSVATIPANSSHTFSFELVAQAATAAGGISPQVYVDTGWGSPATTKQNYNPSTPFSASQPIVVTLPTRIISVSGNLAFGNVTVNSSAQSTMTINNTGNSTMTVSSIGYPSGFSGSWLGTIAAGSSQPVTVTFSPTSASSYGGTVTVYSDMTSGVNTISASGTGTMTATRIISLSGNLAFGDVTVNSSAQSTMTINNTGNSTMTVSSIGYPSGFSGSWSGTIVAGSSQDVTVTFSPTSATSYGGTVTVYSDMTSGVNTISASGTGTVVTATRIISLSGNLAFGNVTVNSSAQSTMTINNTGNSTMTVSSISFPSGFSGSWSGTIAAGNSQNVTVTFSPTSETSYSGTMTVNSDATSGVNTISDSGTGVAPKITPQITNVVFSGTSGNYTITISGSGFGSLAGLPITGDTTNLSIVDFPELGHGAEWGYSGDANKLTYESWTDTGIQVSGFGGQPGDAITIAIWNPITGAGATWGGNVPEGSGTPPQITSVTFAGSGTNLQINIHGSGFGNTPTNMPFVGDLNQLMFQDHFTHSGTGSFEAGGSRWGNGSPDSVTLSYQSWSDNEIVINGFAGSYGQGNNVLQNGDPATIVLWNTSDTGQTGPQTAWGGFVSEQPLIGNGSLQITINPVAAVTAGAQWQVDGGPWQISGTTIAGVSVGSHTVSFSSINGWITPTNQTVTINPNQTTQVTGIYALLSFGIGSPPWGPNGFNLLVYAPTSSNVAVQVSTDLVNWVIWTNLTIPYSPYPISDVSATNSMCRFYRVVIPTLGDNYASDSSLNSSLWTNQSSLLSALAAALGDTLLTPTLNFGTAGMQMSGVNGNSQLAGIQSLAAFAPPFTVSTTVMGTESYGNPFVVFLLNSNLSQWLVIRGDLIPATCYQNIWINYTGTGVPLGNLYSGTPGPNVLYSNPSTNVFYTIQFSVGTDGKASVVLMANGATLASQSTLSVGNGPYYLVLAQQEGYPCVSGPLAATWQSISVTSPP